MGCRLNLVHLEREFGRGHQRPRCLVDDSGGPTGVEIVDSRLDCCSECRDKWDNR